MRRASMATAAVIMSALLIDAFGGTAVATHQPADKVSVAGSTLESMEVMTVDGAQSEEVELFRVSLRSSSPSDLLLGITAECALWTDITNVGNSESEAIAGVKIWLEIDGEPIAVASDGEGSNLENAQVVFCNRAYKTIVTDLDDEDATFQRFLATRNANAFEWITLNVGSGIHEIVAKAQLEANVTGAGMARALVGKRTLVIEPTKLANDATI